MASKGLSIFTGLLALSLGFFAHGEPANATQQNSTATAKLVQSGGLPDLKIHGYKFVPAENKTVRVMVANVGKTKAGASVIRLTVRRVDGQPVGSAVDVPVAGLSANSSQWIVVDANSILPKAAALSSATFRIEVDAAKRVRESNESNNRRWHNM